MKKTDYLRVLYLTCFLAAATGCKRHALPSVVDAAATGPTVIEVEDAPIQSGVKRFGMNLGGQNFYDSGQLLKNLIAINPGFEGETWQSIIRCAGTTESSCTDSNQWAQWPADFLKGASFEVLSGAAQGETGMVTASDPANNTLQDQGVTIHFATPAKPMDQDCFVLVKKVMPGKPEAGWWPMLFGGAALVADTTDLSPATPGKQALEVMAQAPGQGATIASYFDTLKGHSFVQLHGNYRLAFRAKGLSGNRELKIAVRRQTDPTSTYFEKKIVLPQAWHDYTFDFTANESGHSIGTVALTFDVSGSSLLLDDVSLEKVTPDNPTAFRDEVVDTLRDLKPGILRYQDGDHIGSSIENWIAPPFARQRAGWSEGASEMNSIPTGLHEFLQLCAEIHAEPWINMPAGMSYDEMRQLMEYFSGPETTPFGKKRAARGQKAPWTSIFSMIHLEYGNEEWNATTFAGAAMNDPVVYGRRSQQIFGAARTSPFFDAQKFDLVLGSFLYSPDMTRTELASSGNYDSIAIAPYMFNHFNDDHSDESVYSAMFAEPELWDSTPKGIVAQHAAFARGAAEPAKLSVYEINLGTTDGVAPQGSVDRIVPSVGSAVALLDHMLLMLRDLGVKDQSIWELPSLRNGFHNTESSTNETTPLYGMTIDMGGTTNRRRPQFLAEQLVNSALLSTMLKTQIHGTNPTWDQEMSTNDDVELNGAHTLQTFAFSDGNSRSLIVVNLSRADSLPVSFGGHGPHGDVSISHLDAKSIVDNNETAENVRISTTEMKDFNPKSTFALPPYSITVLRWSE